MLGWSQGEGVRDISTPWLYLPWAGCHATSGSRRGGIPKVFSARWALRVAGARYSVTCHRIVMDGATYLRFNASLRGGYTPRWDLIVLSLPYVGTHSDN